MALLSQYEVCGSFADLLPLPRLDLEQPTAPRAIDQLYFKFYGIDFNVNHYLGYVPCRNLAVDNHKSAADCWHIASQVFLPEDARGSLFILHGLFDHVGMCRHLISTAIEQRLAVFAFDLPGHGLSSGERAAIGDFREYTEIFKQLVAQLSPYMPQPWHLAAQSTGATIAINFLYEQQHLFNSHAFFAPLLRPHLWCFTKYTFYILRGMLKQQRRKFRTNSSDIDFLYFVKNRDELQPQWLKVSWISAMEKNLEAFASKPALALPLFIIQGDCDKTIDWRFNIAALRQKFSNTQLLLLHGAGHQLINESCEFRQQWQTCLQRLWHADACVVQK